MRKNTRSLTLGAPSPIPVQQNMMQEWSEVKQITPTLAAKWLEEFHYEGQRPINQRHMDDLVEEMKEGRFVTGEIRICHVGDAGFVTDGRHRLSACAKSGVPIHANVLHVPCVDMNSVAQDYTRCQIPRARTRSELFAATNIIEQTGLTKQQFTQLSAAILPIMGGFSKGAFDNGTPQARSLDVRAKVIRDWAESARTYFEVIHGADKALGRALRRRSVISVALVTVRYQEPCARVFWGGLAGNDGLRKGDPRHTLISYLLATEVTTRNSAEYARKVASAWNTFVKGEEISYLKVNDANKPIRIAGTGYDGKANYVIEVD